MARKKFKIPAWVTWILELLVLVAIGGLFLDGTTEANPILGIIPTVVHTIVGWVILVGGIIKKVVDLM